MARFNNDLFVRNEREAELVAYGDRLAAKIEETAGYYDETGQFPFETFEFLRQQGYFKLTVPKQYGGDEISLYEMLLVQERLARGDGSTALSVGWHLLTFLNVREARPWPEDVFEKLCRDAVNNGDLINIINTERNVGNLVRGGRPTTIAKQTAGGYLITGRKSYASLAPILNHFTIIAYVEDEDINAEFLVTKNEGVNIIETWNTMGMRSTGSHDIDMKDAFVPESALLVRHDPNKPSRFLADGRIYSLEIPAVYLGIAGVARDIAVNFAKTTYSHSLQEYISQASHVRQKIGEIEVLYHSSRSLLYSLADRFERDFTLRDSLSNDVSLVKHIICDNAIKITQLAMKIVGGRSLSRGQKLERLFRDVQCGLFNPPQDDLIMEQLASSALAEQKQHQVI
ncbi:acyl-CoA dehydrogenase family protein [Bacillus massiliigorillae]|uniref:acyl-CoA dehydrogenase family protein n=1 Tax=Bacillus massiliigorillae TaxID=1243664 RepID=UPI0003AAF064|nr:acyl-CoA dehydrogenase family protein [Bacillus massiliigorillae]